jgi:hypothetical protein
MGRPERAVHDSGVCFLFEQSIQLPAKLMVLLTHYVQEAVAMGGFLLQSRVVDLFNLAPSLAIHAAPSIWRSGYFINTIRAGQDHQREQGNVAEAMRICQAVMGGPEQHLQCAAVIGLPRGWRVRGGSGD